MDMDTTDIDVDLMLETGLVGEQEHRSANRLKAPAVKSLVRTCA